MMLIAVPTVEMAQCQREVLSVFKVSLRSILAILCFSGTGY